MKNTIIGAIIGDVVGSTYEWNNCKSVDIDLFNPESTFTDDTVLTIAIADWLVNDGDLVETVDAYGNAYFDRGYGGRFIEWLVNEDKLPYNSWGNGSAMRVSPVGFAAATLEEALELAKQSAEITHNHPDGIIGAQAVAAAIFLAKTGNSKEEIKKYITDTFEYDLDFKLEDIRDDYKFDVTCSGSVPQAIVAFLESTDFESALRLAISIGGDSDTICAICSSISVSFFNTIPDEILNFVISKLPIEFIELLDKFDEKFYSNYFNCK